MNYSKKHCKQIAYAKECARYGCPTWIDKGNNIFLSRTRIRKYLQTAYDYSRQKKVYRGEVMNRKDLLRLRGVGDHFKDLSVEHWDYYTNIDDPELKAFHKGKSYAYCVAAKRIDRLINICEKDISEE